MTKQEFILKYNLEKVNEMMHNLNTPKLLYFTLKSLKSIYNNALLPSSDGVEFYNTILMLEDWVKVIDEKNEINFFDPKWK